MKKNGLKKAQYYWQYIFKILKTLEKRQANPKN